MTIYSLDVLLSQFRTSSISSFNCCFLTCIQSSQEAGQVIWYSHLCKTFPQFIVVHMIKGFGVVNKAEIHVFLEFSCFSFDPMDAGNLISGSSPFVKSSLNIWKTLYPDKLVKLLRVLLNFPLGLLLINFQNSHMLNIQYFTVCFYILNTVKTIYIWT